MRKVFLIIALLTVILFSGAVMAICCEDPSTSQCKCWSSGYCCYVSSNLPCASTCTGLCYWSSDPCADLCDRTNPSVSITPSSQSGYPGDSKYYTVTVTNNDNSECEDAAFDLTRTCPPSWACYFDSNSLTISPGSSSSTTITIRPFSTVSEGDYTISVTATNTDDNSYKGIDSAIYRVLRSNYISITTKYPYAEDRIIPLTSTGEPNFTKTMPIEFLINGAIKDENNPWYSQDCNENNCEAYYDIDGTNWKEVYWKGFENAFFGYASSNDLECSQYHDLNIRLVSDEISSTAKSSFYINCEPKLTVNPREIAVTLGTKNIPAFNVTIWNPLDIKKTYDLSMENADSTQAFLLHWTRFEYNNKCTKDSNYQDDDDKAKATINSRSSSSIMVYLTDDASSVSGIYPIEFVAIGSRLDGEGIIMVYTEGLSEFALWQFFAMLISAVLIIRFLK